MRKIVVSIINYRTAEMTCDCVRSVLDDINDLDVEISIVDNASGDGSVETLTAWIAAEGVADRVRLIPSATNTGFSGGHNQGMNAAEAEFYLILNSDAELRPGCLKALIAAADAAPEAGLIAPQLEHEDGKPQLSAFIFPSPASEFVRGAKTSVVTRLFPRIAKNQIEQASGQDLEWASFACIMLRGETRRAVGPMDEGFFLYFEDVDYTVSARRKGWRVVYEDRAKAVHHRGGSAPVKSLSAARKRLPAYYYASRTRLFYKTYGRFGLLAANLFWTVGECINMLRRVLGSSTQGPNDKEIYDIWTNFWSPLGDRRAPKG